jgi:hypothetical protein
MNEHSGPCLYSTRHRWDGVRATTWIDCGPVVGDVPACDECAAMYARNQEELSKRGM